MAISDTGIGGGRQFPATSWSSLRGAQDPDAPEYARSMRHLVETYWKPVYLMIRRGWARTEADAKDLTQEFFSVVVLGRSLVSTMTPGEGSFRAVLKKALQNFCITAARDAGREKRGGKATLLDLDVVPEVPADARTPEELFDEAWRERVLDQAVKLLEERLRAEGRADMFSLFQRYDLEGERTTVTYGELSMASGRSVPQVKHALRAARAAFGEAVMDVVRGYVDGPDDQTRELQALFGS